VLQNPPQRQRVRGAVIVEILSDSLTMQADSGLSPLN
jgi:hypothetical protein